MLDAYRRRRHGLLGGADVREGGDDWLDVRWQGRKHRVAEGEGEDAWEDGTAAAPDTGCRQVDSEVELPEEVDAQDGPLHVSCDEVELALVQHRLVVLQAKDEGPLRTSGDGGTVGGSEQAALWRSWARYQGHGGPSVGQEKGACGVVLDEDQMSRADGVDTRAA